jgi:Ca2+-binding RTX toxin-like protein
MAFIAGTENNDELFGRNADDNINGAGGDDTIHGGGGWDWLYGGVGNDVIFGDVGYDELYGEAGSDHLYGGDGGDQLAGGDGEDRLYGEAGHDVLNGGAGRDVLKGGGGDDYLVDGEGDSDDLLVGGAGNDRLLGSAGRDTFNGGEGRDGISFNSFGATSGIVADLRRGLILNDGYGNRERMTSIESLYAATNFSFVDKLYGDDGRNSLSIQNGDTAMGFDGDDTIYVNGISGATVDGGEGTDLLFLSDVENGQPVSYNMIVNLRTQMVLDDGFGGSGRIRGFESVWTGRGNDQLTGSDGDNYLRGDSGSDRIEGRAGNDVIFGDNDADHLDGQNGDDLIDGGAGADHLYGGSGNDIYYVDNTGDVVTELADQGNDAVYSSVTYTISANVETLTLTGTAAIDARGSAAADTLIGNGAANHLVGNDGDDVIAPGGGQDIVDGGAGIDTLVLDGTRASYAVRTADGRTTVTGAEGTVQVARIEQVKFADTTVSFAEANASATLGAPASIIDLTDATIPLTLTLHHAAGTSGIVSVSLNASSTAINGATVTVPAYSGGYTVPTSTTGDYLINLSSVAGLDDLIAAATKPAPPRPAATSTVSTMATGEAPGAVIVQSGDSIGAGFTANYAAIDHLGFPDSVVIHNVSVVGITQQTGYRQRATDLFSFNDPRVASVLVIGTGANDLLGGGSGSVLYNNVLRPFVASAQAAGFYVVVNSLLPVGVFGWTAEQEQERLTYNQLVRANAAGADAINDFAADPLIGDARHPATSAYYNDALHPSVAGQQRLAVLDAEALAPFVQPAPPSSLTVNVTVSGQTFANGTDTTSVTVPLIDKGRPGTAGDDVIAVSAAHPSFTGNGGNDVFQGPAAHFAGNYITDFAIGDRIAVTDASYAGFAFQHNGAVLGFNGAFLNIGTANARLLTAASASGGVDLVAVNRFTGLADFDGNGHSDLLWREAGGDFSTWGVSGNATGNKLAMNSTYVDWVDTNWTIAETLDFNGDGRSDILWREQNAGQFTIWNGQGSSWAVDSYSNNTMASDWTIAGVGDLNGDGRDDVVWRQDGGAFSTWQSTGTGFNTNVTYDSSVTPDWKIVGLADFDGDNKDDLIWRNQGSGAFAIWRSTGNGFTLNSYYNASVDTSWHIDGLADFNGDGKDDILWRHDSDGALRTWQSTGSDFNLNVYDDHSVSPVWQVANTGDFDNDGKADLMFRNVTNGTFTTWESNGNGFDRDIVLVSSVSTNWQVQAHDFAFG